MTARASYPRAAAPQDGAAWRRGQLDIPSLAVRMPIGISRLTLTLTSMLSWAACHEGPGRCPNPPSMSRLPANPEAGAQAEIRQRDIGVRGGRRFCARRHAVRGRRRPSAGADFVRHRGAARLLRGFRQGAVQGRRPRRADLRLSRPAGLAGAERLEQAHRHEGLGGARHAGGGGRARRRRARARHGRRRPVLWRPGVGAVRHLRPLHPLRHGRHHVRLSSRARRPLGLAAHVPDRRAGRLAARPGAALARHRRTDPGQRVSRLGALVPPPRLFLRRSGGAGNGRLCRGDDADPGARADRRPLGNAARHTLAARRYAGAPLEERWLSPADGGAPIGHLGFFRSRFSATLWPQFIGLAAGGNGDDGGDEGERSRCALTPPLRRSRSGSSAGTWSPALPPWSGAAPWCGRNRPW